MKDRTELWRLVDDALDARRDPLEDRGVQELLVEDPDAYADIEDALATIAALESRRKPQIARHVGAGVALIALAAAMLWSFSGRSRLPESHVREAVVAPSALDARSRVLSLRIECTHERLGSVSRQAIDAYASTQIDESTLSSGAKVASALSIGPTTISRRLERGL